MSMKQFFTREKANEGKKLMLDNPDGTPSEHFIVIRSVDSDAHQEAAINRDRQYLKAASAESDEEKNQIIKSLRLDVLASLIVDWSLPEKCTPKNARLLLKEAPQIATEIDRHSSNRSFFYESSAIDSVPTSSSKDKTPES